MSSGGLLAFILVKKHMLSKGKLSYNIGDDSHTWWKVSWRQELILKAGISLSSTSLMSGYNRRSAPVWGWGVVCLPRGQQALQSHISFIQQPYPCETPEGRENSEKPERELRLCNPLMREQLDKRWPTGPRCPPCPHWPRPPTEVTLAGACTSISSQGWRGVSDVSVLDLHLQTKYRNSANNVIFQDK